MDKYKNILYWAVGLVVVISAAFGFNSVFDSACTVNNLLNLGIEECASKATDGTNN